MKPYAIGLYEKAIPGDFSFRDKLLCAKECGYDFLEISIDETDAKLSRLDWSAEERLQLVNTMKEVGLPIRSMCLSGHRKYPFGDPDPAVRARSLEIMEKAVILADDLGVRIIQLAGYDVYYKEGTEETRKLFEENLAKATAMAACRGIVEQYLLFGKSISSRTGIHPGKRSCIIRVRHITDMQYAISFANTLVPIGEG